MKLGDTGEAYEKYGRIQMVIGHNSWRKWRQRELETLRHRRDDYIKT